MSIHKVVIRFWWAVFSIAALAIALAVGIPAMNAQGADHLDAPLVTAEGRTDINDVYAWSPTSTGTTVLIMTVNPDAGVLSPTTFHPKAKYRFLIDNNGDASADMTLEVNGVRKQTGSTKTLIFGIAELVSFISRNMTLEPGDVVSTGTPPGVGAFRDPPEYLQPGDTLELTIEKLGKQCSKVVREP